MRMLASLAAFIFTLALLSSASCGITTAYAISAAPETHSDDAQGCRSLVTGPPITLNSLDKRNANASEEYLELLSEIDSGTQGDGSPPAQDNSTQPDRLSLQAVPLQPNPASSDIPLLIIVVGFSNISYSTDIDWGNRVFGSGESLSRYYLDMSLSTFSFDPAQESSAFDANDNTNTSDAANDGIVHVVLPSKHRAWGEDDESSDKTLMSAFSSAIELASNDVDFARYDANEDGEISQDELALGFIVAGYEAAAVDGYPHGKNFYLWSHASSISEIADIYEWTDVEAPTVDGVRVDSYIAIAEYEDDDRPNNVGTIAHELGHYLGLPDLYDTSYSTIDAWRRYEVNLLSLMAGGNYVQNENGESSMASLDAWSRSKLGWIDPQTANTEGGISTVVSQFSTKGTEGAYNAIRVPTSREHEYYLVENRQFAKWDYGLREQACDGPDGGLLIWHIDESVYDAHVDTNTVNNANHRPAIMPLFIEQRGRKFTMIGTNPLCSRAFFDASTWANSYASDIASGMPLPMYGEDGTADTRSSRSLSKLGIRFLDDAQQSMRIWIGHVHVFEFVKALEPTCLSNGNIEHWKCSTCGKLYTDKDDEESEIDLSATIVQATKHELDHFDPVAPTCTETGSVEYWKCRNCGTTFANADAETTIGSSEIRRAALGHDFGAWKRLNDAQHVRACSRDATHTQTENHNWKKTATVQPTSRSEGRVDYHCSDCGAAKAEHLARLKHPEADTTMAVLGVDGATADAIAGYALAQGITMNTLAITERTIVTSNADADMVGSRFNPLKAMSKKQTKKSATLTWSNMTGADGYRIYGALCGKAHRCKQVASLPASTRSFTAKELKSKAYYKFIVIAYKRFGGNDVTIAASPTIHVTTKGGTCGNPKKLKIARKGSTKGLSSLTLKRGKSATIKTKASHSGKTVKKHRAVKYLSTNEKVASITQKGKVFAKASGACKVIAYAQNGICKTISIKVR